LGFTQLSVRSADKLYKQRRKIQALAQTLAGQCGADDSTTAQPGFKRMVLDRNYPSQPMRA
jgi:hypothetical protein